MQNKILIIEDETLLLHFLEQRLKMEGYEVDIARDGNEAIKQLERNSYSLITLDLMLPFVSGFELIAKIRKEKRNSETPVLVVSALGSENTIVDALSMGANDFLKKPFEVKVLLTKIKLMLGGHELLKAV